MKEIQAFLPVLFQSPLFFGMDSAQVLSMLNCLGARLARFEAQHCILRFGEVTAELGLVVEGSVQILRDDFWGNRNIFAFIGPGHTFAETWACVPDTPIQVNVVATEKTSVLFLNMSRVLSTCSSACEFHHRLIHNLVSVLAQKNLSFNEKVSFLSRRSTRAKLLSYLSAQSARHGSAAFCIPYNRQELADYLSVDRSALSAELSRLSAQGVLRFSKNHFELCAPNSNFD